MPKDDPLHAENYAEIAVKYAERAKNAGTFGVGGLLIGNDGSVFRTVQNITIVFAG